MAPSHTQGCGGRHIVRRHISHAQQTKNWCVGFSFPPPAYVGIHPTLDLFGFRANALNSHSPLICLALIRDLVSSASGALREASGSSRLPLRGFGGFGAFFVRTLGLVVGFASFLSCQPCSCLADPEISAFPGHLQGRPGQWPPRAALGLGS